MKVGVVDIGTNSMRLLITDGVDETGRWVEVTGLGRGVDQTGRLAESAIDATVSVLAGYRRLMDEALAGRRLAIATSASRDAANREAFFDRCEEALGVRPTLISGEEEARLAYEGASWGLSIDGDLIVSDIGGGSTEIVWEGGSVSVDIGSVRLTDRVLDERPASPDDVAEARALVRLILEDVPVWSGQLVGVAGTWTSLAAIEMDLPAYDGAEVHGHGMSRERVDDLVGFLSGLTLAETEAIPSLDPKRAPVMLSGAVVAASVMEHLDADEVKVSERDTLDGAARRLLALA
ncbi:MAG: Ppx/GppA phosphatase family protein [Acidimicrobiia bacterium]|nr:Ppx/GppA phosphatase family protein [Acidimicrobiia bacterium]